MSFELKGTGLGGLAASDGAGWEGNKRALHVLAPAAIRQMYFCLCAILLQKPLTPNLKPQTLNPKP